MRPVGFWVLESGNVVAQGLAVSLDKPLEWAVGFFFGNPELIMELWTVTADIPKIATAGCAPARDLVDQ